MDIRSLEYVVTLAEELHFGRAAQAHYISAQPFGRRIQALERELGTRLFERTSRRVSLTEAGKRFVPRARRALADIDALSEPPTAPSAGTVLRIGVLGFGLADLWPATQAILTQEDPDITLVYVELDWENQYDAVRMGDVDVAVLHDIGGADDLAVEGVTEVERYAVVPAASDLAEADRLTASDITNQPCVIPVGQRGLAEWVGGHVLTSGVEVRSPSNIPLAVATTGTLGIYAEPARRYFPHPDVRYIPLEGPGGAVALASREGDHQALVAHFRHAVRASKRISKLSRPHG